MSRELTNSPSGESANLNPPTEIDNPENLNFWEPEEANPGDEEQTGIEAESEPAEASEEDGQEAETPTDDEAESEEEADEAEIKDDVTVNVNGEKIALSELKAGYMKQSDYSRKTQELGNKRRDLEQMTTRVTQSVEAIANFLAKQLPDAPDTSLAMTDPGRYVREKAMYDASMAQINAIIEQANAPKEVVNKLSEEQRIERLQAEDAKLREAFPHLSDPAKREKFFTDTTRVAQELGYSLDEIKGVDDHRLFKLAHWARLGMEAEKAKAKVAQKVEKVPPVVPPKRAQQKNAAQIRSNQDAMRRLSRTGSIHDALGVDFD
jgi:regulator of replication initiation timing